MTSNFISALHFEQGGMKKVIFYPNPGTTCKEASDFSNSLLSLTFKNPRVHTYELGCINHQIEDEYGS